MAVPLPGRASPPLLHAEIFCSSFDEGSLIKSLERRASLCSAAFITKRERHIGFVASVRPVPVNEESSHPSCVLLPDTIKVGFHN